MRSTCPCATVLVVFAMALCIIAALCGLLRVESVVCDGVAGGYVREVFVVSCGIVC